MTLMIRMSLECIRSNQNQFTTGGGGWLHETAILRMIKETDGEKYEDTRSLIQELTFHETAKAFSARNIPYGINQQRSLKLMNDDGIYSNLGLLLSDQCRHSIKLAVFEGTTKAVFQDRREFSGSLLKQLNDAYEFIDRYNRIRAEFKGLHRVDKRDYPEGAVREALLNALVHRDYSYSAGTLISIFDDRLEFISIGGLVKGISYDDIMLGISITRNENLTHIFYRLVLLEAYGTGIPKIIQSYTDSPVAPRIEVSDNAFKMVLPNMNYHINESTAEAQLSDNEQAVIRMFDTQPYITRKDVEHRLSLSQAMAVRLLRGLCDMGAIKSLGSGKNTKYAPSGGIV